MPIYCLKTFARLRESKHLRRWATAIVLVWLITCFLSLTPVALPLNHISLDTSVPPGHHHHHHPSKRPHKLTLKTIVPPTNNDGHRFANQLLNNQAPNITKPVTSPILRKSSRSSWVASLSSIYAGNLFTNQQHDSFSLVSSYCSLNYPHPPICPLCPPTLGCPYSPFCPSWPSFLLVLFSFPVFFVSIIIILLLSPLSALSSITL